MNTINWRNLLLVSAIGMGIGVLTAKVLWAFGLTYELGLLGTLLVSILVGHFAYRLGFRIFE